MTQSVRGLLPFSPGQRRRHAGWSARILPLAALLALTLPAGISEAGLVSHWKAENDATDAADGNDGVNDGVTYAAGKIGQAFSFDGGAEDEILVADAANLRFPSGVSFTLTAWVKTTASDFYYHDILRRRNRDTGGGWLDVKLSMTSALASFPGRATFSLLNVLNANSVAIIYGTTILNDGEWHHCAAVYKAISSEMRLYVDGIREGGTPTISGGFNQSPPTTGWNIGNNPDSQKSPWLGLIDDVSVWNEALSAEEARAMHSLGDNATLHYAADDVALLIALHDAGSGTTITSDEFTWEFVADGLTGDGTVQEAKGSFSVELGTAGSGVRTYGKEPDGIAIQIR